MKKVLLSLFVISVLTLSFAASKKSQAESDAETRMVSRLAGQITDNKTKEPLVGVKVVLDDADDVAYTDFDGNYCFEEVRMGQHSLKASYVSYNDSSVGDVVVRADGENVDIRLNCAN